MSFRNEHGKQQQHSSNNASSTKGVVAFVLDSKNSSPPSSPVKRRQSEVAFVNNASNSGEGKQDGTPHLTTQQHTVSFRVRSDEKRTSVAPLDSVNTIPQYNISALEGNPKRKATQLTKKEEQAIIASIVFRDEEDPLGSGIAGLNKLLSELYVTATSSEIESAATRVCPHIISSDAFVGVTDALALVLYLKRRHERKEDREKTSLCDTLDYAEEQWKSQHPHLQEGNGSSSGFGEQSQSKVPQQQVPFKVASSKDDSETEERGATAVTTTEAMIDDTTHQLVETATTEPETIFPRALLSIMLRDQFAVDLPAEVSNECALSNDDDDARAKTKQATERDRKTERMFYAAFDEEGDDGVMTLDSLWHAVDQPEIEDIKDEEVYCSSDAQQQTTTTTTGGSSSGSKGAAEEEKRGTGALLLRRQSHALIAASSLSQLTIAGGGGGGGNTDDNDAISESLAHSAIGNESLQSASTGTKRQQSQHSFVQKKRHTVVGASSGTSMMTVDVVSASSGGDDESNKNNNNDALNNVPDTSAETSLQHQQQDGKGKLRGSSYQLLTRTALQEHHQQQLQNPSIEDRIAIIRAQRERKKKIQERQKKRREEDIERSVFAREKPFSERAAWGRKFFSELNETEREMYGAMAHRPDFYTRLGAADIYSRASARDPSRRPTSAMANTSSLEVLHGHFVLQRDVVATAEMSDDDDDGSEGGGGRLGHRMSTSTRMSTATGTSQRSASLRRKSHLLISEKTLERWNEQQDEIDELESSAGASDAGGLRSNPSTAKIMARGRKGVEAGGRNRTLIEETALQKRSIDINVHAQGVRGPRYCERIRRQCRKACEIIDSELQPKKKEKFQPKRQNFLKM